MTGSPRPAPSQTTLDEPPPSQAVPGPRPSVWQEIRQSLTAIDRTELREFVIAGAPIAGLITVLGVLAMVIFAAGSQLHSLAEGAVRYGLVRTVVEPIRGYITEHAHGLPADPDTIAAAWGLGALVLLVAAVCGSWGARLGWLVVGAGSVAMAWAGTALDARWVTAALTALAWSLATALVVGGRRAAVHVHNVLPRTARPPRTAPVTEEVTGQD